MGLDHHCSAQQLEHLSAMQYLCDQGADREASDAYVFA